MRKQDEQRPTTSNYGYAYEEQSNLSMLKVLEVLRRRKAYLVIPAVISLVAFAVLGWSLPPTYESTALLTAEAITDETEVQDAVTPVWIEDHLRTINETVTRASLLEEVARRHDLYETVDGRVPEESLADMRSSIKVRMEGNNAFSISFSGDDRQTVAAVAGDLAEGFMQRMARARSARIGNLNTVLDRELENLRRKLDRQDQQIQEYRRSSAHELPENLWEYVGEASKLRESLRYKDEEISRLEGERTQVATELEAMESRGLLERDPRVEELEDRLVQLRQRYTEEHPEVKQARQELEALRSSGGRPAAGGNGGNGDPQMRHIELQARLGSIDRRLAAAREQKQELESQIASANSRIEAVPRHESELADLIRERDVTKWRYETLFERQQDVEVAGQLASSNLGLTFQIEEPARVPLQPSGPQRLRYVIMGLVVGLAVGLGLTLVAENTDTSFADVEDLRSFTTLPVLASIPSISINGHPRGGDGGKARPRIPILYEPFGVAAEQYRILAMRLRRLADDGESRIVMVTSAAGGEGKTTTAVNLALALASQAPGKVVLVDGDLRRPKIHEHLGNVDSHEASGATHGGFKEMLDDPDGDIRRCLQPLEQLQVMASPATLERSYETLDEEVERVLGRLRERFTHIVLDAPPVLPMVDGHMLAEKVDQLLFVVRARRTRREVLERTGEFFDFSKVLGVVLNDVDYGQRPYNEAYEYYRKAYMREAQRKATA